MQHGDRLANDPCPQSEGGEYWSACIGAWRRPDRSPMEANPAAPPTTHRLLKSVGLAGAATALAAAAVAASGGSARKVLVATAATAAIFVAAEGWLHRRLSAETAPPPRAQYRHPFMYDTVWDLMRLLDHLASRGDVDTSRVAATGISLGGMHAWLWAAVDERVTSACPAIGVQNFEFAIENDVWQVCGLRPSVRSVWHALCADPGAMRTVCQAL